jgi:hypothetical protein
MNYDLKPFIEVSLDTAMQQGSAWFESTIGKVFVRVQDKAYNGLILKVLTVANVDVYERGRGTFTRWLETVEATVLQTPAIKAVYIESVLDIAFTDFFIRNGYTALPETPVFNFIKVLNQ